MTPDEAAIRAAHYPMTGEEDWCVGCQDGQYPCDVVALLAALDEANAECARSKAEVDRLRALAEKSTDRAEALSACREEAALVDRHDAERARAIPVITAAKALRDNTHLIHDVSYQEWADPLWDALMEYERGGEVSIDLEAIRSRSALYGDPEWRGKHSLWVQVACDDAVTLLAEVDRLRALVNDGIPWTCIYCGRLWPVSEPVDVLREHVIVCEKHPAARALPVIEAARGLIEHHPPRDPALAALRATLAAYEGDKP